MKISWVSSSELTRTAVSPLFALSPDKLKLSAVILLDVICAAINKIKTLVSFCLKTFLIYYYTGHWFLAANKVLRPRGAYLLSCFDEDEQQQSIDWKNLTNVGDIRTRPKETGCQSQTQDSVLSTQRWETY